MEEILFRKLFLDRLLVIGETGAIIISAILFGLPHAFSQGIPQMFGTFLIGLVWAYMRVKTGKLWPGIILHIMFNLYGCYFATFMAMRPVTTVLFMLMGIILLPTIAVIILITHMSVRKN
jgi:membrane protease YdiL (CAAX protease family)